MLPWEGKRRGEKKGEEPPNQKKPPMPMSLDSKATEQEGDNNKIPKYLLVASNTFVLNNEFILKFSF
jgi:hypothetical protein